MSEEKTVHPRDRFITIFGHKPVMEALNDRSLHIDKVLVDRNDRNVAIKDIILAAEERGIMCKRVDAREVSRISKNPKQDQGVVADVIASNMVTADGYFAAFDAKAPAQLVAIDGVTTPANVGMIIRSAAAAGMDGVILPRHGTAELGPLVIKATAGTLFKVKIIRCEKIEEALGAARDCGFAVLALDETAKESLFDAALPAHAIYVMGNESVGLSDAAQAQVTKGLRIPMAKGVDSLNVAMAAAVVCFEAVRRKSA